VFSAAIFVSGEAQFDRAGAKAGSGDPAEIGISRQHQNSGGNRQSEIECIFPPQSHRGEGAGLWIAQEQIGHRIQRVGLQCHDERRVHKSRTGRGGDINQNIGLGGQHDRVAGAEGQHILGRGAGLDKFQARQGRVDLRFRAGKGKRGAITADCGPAEAAGGERGTGIARDNLHCNCAGGVEIGDRNTARRKRAERR
jgi:hypothetical protein